MNDLIYFLPIIAVTIILTVLSAKRKKQTFSAIALFLLAIPLYYSSDSLIRCFIYYKSRFVIRCNVVFELIVLIGVVINIIFLVKNRTVRTKDLNVVSCPQCGTLLPTGKKFCTKCGAELNPTTENESI